MATEVLINNILNPRTICSLNIAVKLLKIHAFIPMVHRIIALLAGFTSLSVKSDRYKLLCTELGKKSMFILQPVVILAVESASLFSW